MKGSGRQVGVAKLTRPDAPRETGSEDPVCRGADGRSIATS
jgi:hypothetical protein